MRQLCACLLFPIFLLITQTTTAAPVVFSQNSTTTSAIEQRLQELDLPLATSSTDSRFRNKLQQFLRGPRGTSRIVARSERYFPIFERVLCDLDLPSALKYLPVVESTLDVRAVSNRGAAGLWQLMPGTARSLGLRVDDVIDERYDVEKSTYAAGRLLTDLYAELGDWRLTLAAYNAGLGRVNQAIRRAGRTTDYARVKRHLPRETRNYIANYTAAAYILNYHCAHGIPAAKRVPTQTVSIPIFRGRSLGKLARMANTDYRTLRRLNPSLQQGYVPTVAGGYRLKLPEDRFDSLQIALWGKPNLVYADDFSIRQEEVALAQVQGLELNAWLLGVGQLVDYTPGPKYRRIAADWSRRWIEQTQTYALLD